MAQGARVTGAPADSLRSRLAARLRTRFALRVHTAILLAWTFSAGLLTTKGLLVFGVHAMYLRYTIAIVVAYGAFLLGVRIWLAYVGAGAGGSGNVRNADRRKDGSTDLPDLSSSGGGSSGGGASSGGGFRGGGGSSGGGGASASFGEVAPPQPNLMMMENPNLSASGGAGAGGSGGGGSDSSLLGDVGGKVGDAVGGIGGGDDGCLIAFAIMIVIGLIALAIGGAFFVISMGPEVLIDAAFNAMLSGGLIKAGKRVSDPGWVGSVIKGTWKPLAIVLAMAWLFTGTAAVLTPKAHTFGEVMRIVWPLLLENL